VSPKNTFHFHPRLLVCAAAVTSVFILNSTQAFADSDTNTKEAKEQRKARSTENMVFGTHVQHQAKTAAERKPKQAQSINARVSYNAAPEVRSALLKRPSKLASNKSRAELNSAPRGITTAAAVATCDRNAFASATGANLVNLVKSSTTDCINDLFGVSGSQAYSIFKEAQMVTIANAFRTEAAAYNGTNSGSALQMVTFLRAGYYVQYYDTAVGAYGTALQTSIRSAMDAFVNNGNFGLVNDVHGEILSEFVTLVDSSSENARYLSSVVKRLLSNFNSTYTSSWWMASAVNNVFTVLFRGHQNADFKALVLSDTSIIDTMYNFINANFNLLGTDNDYLVSNAGRELGRFLQYADNTSLKSLAKSRVKTLVDRSNVTGTTAPLWVGLGEMVDYYDKANCSYYSLCDFVTKLDTNILPIKYSCSPTLRLKAQSLTTAQLQEACTIVGGEESYFHQQVASGKIPVANDNNTQLEMVIFSSSKDYGTYAGAIYGIDTNNGGMYLEGDPSLPTNQPRFIAYQAEWMLPKFEIWNLTHEYIHYLDGRFDMFGDFNASASVDDIWWIEGFAEYMSYSYRKLAYTDAQNQAAAGTYSLSQIFKNNYNSGQTRIYNWGYLATRYMFEKQRSKVSSILGYFRPGNYAGYTSYMNSIGTSLDTDFKNWLPCVNNPALPQCGQPQPGNVAPVASFTSSVNSLNVNFTDTSTDSDGTIASRVWNFGDGTATSTLASPSHAFAKAGTYTVTLTVTDNGGAQSSTTKSITVSTTPPVNVPPVASFTNSIAGLTVNFTDTSTDSDGSIASRSWNFGDGTTSTLANPAKSYTAAGTYTVSLTVTDNAGAKTTTTKTVTVVSSNGLPECPGSAQALGKNCSRSNVSGVAGDYAYMYVNIPAGTTSLKITTSGGTGNADLYVSTLGTWATRNYYNYGSRNAGNSESVIISNPPAGYVYISLYGASAFSGVKVTTEY